MKEVVLNIYRRHFSKIRSDSSYIPKKDTVISLCLSMKMSFEEAKEIMQCAGYTFSDGLRKDLIAKFFFQNKIYDIYVYREILNKFGG